MPAPITPQGQTTLHRFTIKPGHVDQYLPILDQEIALAGEHGFVTHRVFVETNAEPRVSWLYSHPDPLVGQVRLAQDERHHDLGEAKQGHVFRNLLVRPVEVEAMTTLEPGDAEGRIAILRRYSIVGDWDDFLGFWRRIAPLRERHGFRVLFAVTDRPRDLFTWAFDFAGTWEEFPTAQAEYYADPERAELRSVFDHMADYLISPARMLH